MWHCGLWRQWFVWHCGLCYVAIFNIGNWIFGNLGMFVVQNSISSCDVSVCDISGLFDIAVCIMSCSIMSATVFLAIWDVQNGRSSCDFTVCVISLCNVLIPWSIIIWFLIGFMAANAAAIITSMTAQRHHISFTATCSPVSWFGQTMSDNLVNIYF